MPPKAPCSVLDMWRVAALGSLLVAASASACGGGGKPLAETARPCLEKLGQYVHHRPEKGPPADPTPRLPLLDPENPPVVGQTPKRLPWPDGFEEYGEVLYSPTNPGANAVQIFIFDDEELPTQVMDVTRKAERHQTFFVGSTLSGGAVGTRFVRIGQSLVQWSSAPSPNQRTTVRDCLT